MEVKFPLLQKLPDWYDGPVKTISKLTGIVQHKSLHAAVRYAEVDSTVHIISYMTECGYCKFKLRVEYNPFDMSTR